MTRCMEYYIPDELGLKLKFADFPLIIKNAIISREDLSPYTLKIAKEKDCLKKPRQYLISSYFGKNILINSEIAKFHLSMGLVIIEIQ